MQTNGDTPSASTIQNAFATLGQVASGTAAPNGPVEGLGAGEGLNVEQDAPKVEQVDAETSGQVEKVLRGGRRRSRRRAGKKSKKNSKKSSARKSKKGGRSRRNGSKRRAHRKH
jgi:hypothetical protein